MPVRSVTRFGHLTSRAIDAASNEVVDIPSSVPFHERFNSTATVYRHHDGHPSFTVQLLKSFFHQVEIDTATGRTSGTRYNDPSYLAAKFVVFLANRYRMRDGFAEDAPAFGGPLNFLNVGIVTDMPNDIEYEWFIDSSNAYDNEPHRPMVWYRPISSSRQHDATIISGYEFN